MKSSIVLLLCFIVAFEGCPNGETPSGFNIVCLVDFSGSIPAETRQWYAKVIADDIIRSLSYEDNITLLPVDYGSQTGSRELFRADLAIVPFERPLDPPQRREDLRRRRLAAHKDTLVARFWYGWSKAEKERKLYAKGTDILGGMRQAQKYFRSGRRNIVIVFSDMVQETEELNLTRRLNSGEPPGTIAAKAPAISLDRASLLVLTGEQPSLSINRFNQLKEFWASFCSRNNIALDEYESSGTSLLASRLSSYRPKEE